MSIYDTSTCRQQQYTNNKTTTKHADDKNRAHNSTHHVINCSLELAIYNLTF